MNFRVGLMLICIELNQPFQRTDFELSRSNLNSDSRFEDDFKGLHFCPLWVD